MKLLLHCCCGPCTISVADHFRTRGDAVTGWFCNPNLLPEEWERRRESFDRAAEAVNLERRAVDHQLGFLDFLLAIARGKGRRCEACYELRLTAAANKAREEGIRLFSTTLLVSPYQKHELIRDVGRTVQKATGVEFLYSDWRPRWRETRTISREEGLYLQKYCGCIFSEKERYLGAQGGSSGAAGTRQRDADEAPETGL